MQLLVTVNCDTCGKQAKQKQQTKATYRCHPCRRITPGTATPGTCARCGAPNHTVTATYCSLTCFARANGARKQIRADDDQHVQRSRREANAPGLTYAQRKALLRKWRTQQRVCAYCGNTPGDTVDHVVPLVRGGTNYEGNLVPCCRSCNGSKGGALIIEWRTGRRLPRMTKALPLRAPRVKVIKAIKEKPAPVIKCCPICTTMHHAKSRCCSIECQREHAAREVRDLYRMRHNLPIDSTIPTRPLKRKAIVSL